MKKGKHLCILIIISLFFITGCSKYDVNEYGIVNGTYKHIDENEKESRIIIKDNKLTFEDVDFTEVYESLALLSLSLEYSTGFNDLGQENIEELLEQRAYALAREKNYKINTEYEYVYSEEKQTISLKNELTGVIINYKISEDGKPYLEFYSKTFER